MALNNQSVEQLVRAAASGPPTVRGEAMSETEMLRPDSQGKVRDIYDLGDKLLLALVAILCVIWVVLIYL